MSNRRSFLRNILAGATAFASAKVLTAQEMPPQNPHAAAPPKHTHDHHEETSSHHNSSKLPTSPISPTA